MTEFDVSSWPRREIYEFFSAVPDPFYGLSFSVDVTALKRYAKAAGLSFYYCLSYLAVQAMEGIEAFRLRIRDGRLYLTDELVPSCTDMEGNSGVFRFLTVRKNCSMETFCRRVSEQRQRQQGLLDAQSEAWDDLVFISCVPWLEITGVSSTRAGSPDDCTVKLTWGRYREQQGRLILNMTLEANHRTVDGWHIGQFYEALQRSIDALPALHSL